jgi:hypothetical protein
MSTRGKRQSSEWEELRLTSVKLRAIAHLIETQKDGDEGPLDIEEIRWGLGMILTEFSQTVRELSRSLEKKEMELNP